MFSDHRNHMTKRGRILFAAIVAAQVAYAAGSIWRSSAVVAGERYFVLGDDAMVSMRYAKNLASGHGLVWNVGEERVEGYTNPLWVIVMAAIHLLPLAPSKTSAGVEIVSAVLLLLNLFVTRRLARSAGASDGAALVAVFLTAFYYPLNSWGLRGSELALLVPLVGMALVAAIRILALHRFSSVPYWLLGIATLIRPDAVLIYVTTWSVVAWYDRDHRRTHAVYGALVLALFVVAQTAFRIASYHDWLPTTYSLRMTAYPIVWRVSWGVYALAYFVWRRNWVGFLLAALAVARPNPPRVLLGSVAAAQFAYSAFIGISDYRFTSTVMPLVFVLMVIGAADLASLLMPRIREVLPSANLRAATASALLLLTLLTFNPDWREWIELGPPAPVVLVERALALEAITSPDARIAVARAGVIPYFSNRPAVDLLGKNDRMLARQPANAFYNSFAVPHSSAHMKWDYAYSIDTLQPDIVVELWRRPESATPSLRPYQAIAVADDIMYARRGSARVLWGRVKAPRLTDPGP